METAARMQQTAEPTVEPIPKLHLSLEETVEYETMEKIWKWIHADIHDNMKRFHILDELFYFGNNSWQQGFNDCHQVHHFD
jgi:hypothetical protein